MMEESAYLSLNARGKSGLSNIVWKFSLCVYGRSDKTRLLLCSGAKRFREYCAIAT